MQGDDPLPAGSHHARAEQGGSGGGDAEGNAIQAQAAGERFVVAESVLEGDGESVICKTFRQLTCGAFRLPGFDKHERVI